MELLVITLILSTLAVVGQLNDDLGGKASAPRS